MVAHYPTQVGTRWDFTGAVAVPFSPHDPALHGGRSDAADRIRRVRTHPKAGRDRLRYRGANSPSTPAEARPCGVAWTGLFVVVHCWPTLAAFPGAWASGFSPRFLTEHGFGQVGLGR